MVCPLVISVSLHCFAANHAGVATLMTKKLGQAAKLEKQNYANRESLNI